jgi:hypothetical protein
VAATTHIEKYREPPLAYGTAKAALAHDARLAAADLMSRIRANGYRRRCRHDLRAEHRAHRRRAARGNWSR